MPESTLSGRAIENGDRPTEVTENDTPAEEPELPAGEVSLTEMKKRRPGLLQGLGKLKPLLPILSGGLSLVDHSIARVLVQLLSMANGSGGSSTAQEELNHDLAEIQSHHRELHLQVQDQTVELQRIEDQLTFLRQTVEQNAAEHARLSENVRALNNLVRIFGAALAVLLAALIVLTIFLLVRPH